ncbi:hypothetical protein GVAV_001237 [Gurleya vavrai]
MKKKLELDIFKIQEAPLTIYTYLIEILANSKNLITTFNQLMTLFELKKTKGILFVNNNDTNEIVVFQHLVLFAKHYEIEMFSMKKGFRNEMEEKLKIKNVFLVFVDIDNEIYNKIVDKI